MAHYTDIERIAALETSVENLRGTVDKLVEDVIKPLTADVKALTGNASMGKGAMKMLFIVGGIVAALGALGAWVIEHLPKLPH